MGDGSVMDIEDIKVGDMVNSFTDDGNIQISEVLELESLLEKVITMSSLRMVRSWM
jgi:hypothetical protein